MIKYLSHLLFAFSFLIGVAAAQSFNPCDSGITFVDRNMIDYTVKVRRVRGSVIDPSGIAVPKGCIALFNADHSKLLQTVEASLNGEFTINGVKNGDYWLVVQDPQRAFCPAAARVRLRRLLRRSKIIVHMEGAGIDQCSYCESR